MPIYEYKCNIRSCHHVFDLNKTIKARDSLTYCPKCKEPGCSRGMNTGGVIYRDNDFRAVTKKDTPPHADQ